MTPRELDHPTQAMPPRAATDGGTLLALSIDARHARACLLENIHGLYRLGAWSVYERHGERHLGNLVAQICRQLGQSLGRVLWNEEAHMPLLLSDDPVRYPPIEQLTLALSPEPPLRVWLAGLTETYSLSALRRAVAAGAAEVVGTTHLTIDSSSATLVQALTDARPDVLLIVGGFNQDDSAARQPMSWLSTIIAGAYQRLPRRRRPALIYAGNHFAAKEAERLLQTVGAAVTVMPNVMPRPGMIRQDVLAHAIADYTWQRNRQVDGYTTIEQWSTSPVPPADIESNFMRLVQTWLALQQLPELHAIYNGVRRLHVWANEGEDEVAVHYAEDLGDGSWREPFDWPAPQLLSGPWPDATPPSTLRWWDRHGLAPVVAGLGPVSPAALYQTLAHDLLLPVT